MAKSDITVEALVAKIQRGELVWPESKRPYVWRATRIRDLLSSRYQSFLAAHRKQCAHEGAPARTP